MRNTFRTIMLIMLSAVAFVAAGQGYVIDRVCVGAERHYRIDGETGSTYAWQLTDENTVVTTLPETADTVTILWNVPSGIYILSNIQYSIHGCDSLQLGTIEVFEQPDAFAGNAISLCTAAPVTLDLATAGNYSSLQWSTSGDGTFDDDLALHPVYTPGSGDLAAGSVTLTLTANGLGNSGSCPPAVSTLLLTIGNMLTDIDISHAACNNNNGKITVIATGGTGALEYKLVSFTGWQNANLFTDLAAGTYSVMIRDAQGCETTVSGIVILSVAGPQIVDVNTSPATGGLENGTAEVIANGTALPLMYSIDGINWQLSNMFTDLPVGSDTAWVRDANLCTDFWEFIVMQTIDGIVEVSADTTSYCLNIPIILPIDAKDFTGVASFLIELEFDPAILQYVELLNEHNALANGYLSHGVSGNILQIRFSIFNSSVTIPSGEQLFSIHFEGLAAGLSNLDWNLLQCNIYSASGDIIPSIFTPGQIEVLQTPVIYADGNGEYCEGDTLTLHAGALDGQQLNYVWTGPTGFNHNNPVWQLGQLGMNDDGNFRVVATNPDLCKEEQLVSVQVNPKPVIYIGYADTICYGTQVLLDPGSGYVSYLWQDGSTAPSQMAYEEGIYWVQVTDTNSCRAFDTVQLVPCNIELLIPNAFTPNGDGLNDTFKPLFRGFEPSQYSMTVYSKWGQLIFTTTDTEIGWDGTIDGELVMPGTFAYVVVYEAPSYVMRTLPSPIAGDVTVLR